MNTNEATKKATELVDALDKLCEDIVKAHDEDFPSLAGKIEVNAKKGQKFIKIIRQDSDGSGRSVWGFINLKHSDFEVGDVLLAKSWKAPALNKARGNLLNGRPYIIKGMRQYGPGYLSGYCAGGKRNGGLV